MQALSCFARFWCNQRLYLLVGLWHACERSQGVSNLSFSFAVIKCLQNWQVVLATKADNTALAALRELVEKGGMGGGAGAGKVRY